MWSHVHIHLSLKVFYPEFARSKWKNSAPKKQLMYSDLLHMVFFPWCMSLGGETTQHPQRSFSFRPNLESNLRCVKGKSGPITYKAMELGRQSARHQSLVVTDFTKKIDQPSVGVLQNDCSLQWWDIFCRKSKKKILQPRGFSYISHIQKNVF